MALVLTESLVELAFGESQRDISKPVFVQVLKKEANPKGGAVLIISDGVYKTSLCITNGQLEKFVLEQIPLNSLVEIKDVEMVRKAGCFPIMIVTQIGRNHTSDVIGVAKLFPAKKCGSANAIESLGSSSTTQVAPVVIGKISEVGKTNVERVQGVVVCKSLMMVSGSGNVFFFDLCDGESADDVIRVCVYDNEGLRSVVEVFFFLYYYSTNMFSYVIQKTPLSFA